MIYTLSSLEHPYSSNFGCWPQSICLISADNEEVALWKTDISFNFRRLLVLVNTKQELLPSMILILLSTFDFLSCNCVCVHSLAINTQQIDRNIVRKHILI